MRIKTQTGIIDLDPECVLFIQPVSVNSDDEENRDLNHYVEIRDDCESYGFKTVRVSESVAKALSKESGVEIPERKKISRKTSDNIFVPFEELLLLGDCQIILTSLLTIRSRLLTFTDKGSMHNINDLLGFLASFIEQL